MPDHTLNYHRDVPRLSYVPDVSAATEGYKHLDAGSSQTCQGALVTINAGDTMVAATRFANGGPGVFYVPLGESISIASDEPVTSAYVVGLASADAGGCMDQASPDITNALAQQTAFTFDEADNIRIVTAVCTNVYNSSREASVIVGGSGDA